MSPWSACSRCHPANTACGGWQQVDRDNPAYNTPLAVHFPDGIDQRAIRVALAALVDRHEMLRMRYPTDDAGEPGQTPVPGFEIPLFTLDVPADESWHVPAQAFINQPFDLAQSPPLRAAILRCVDGTALLMLIIHHIAVDGVSWRVFVPELATLYEAARRGEPAELPPLTVTFTDFVARREAEVADGTVARTLGYCVTNCRV